MGHKRGVQAKFTGYGTGRSSEGVPLVVVRFEITTPGPNEGRSVTTHFTPEEMRQRAGYLVQLADQLDAQQAQRKGDTR